VRVVREVARLARSFYGLCYHRCDMSVFAFDIDGTLETSSGPVTISRLDDLRRAGHYVYLVSPSEARPKGLPIVAGGAHRSDNLRQVKAMHPDEAEFIYVSDNGDMTAAAEAGWEYVWHTGFGA
jgi:hydroxymethylpyrimidine pyrophosphatase-like HAD family hydrolase